MATILVLIYLALGYWATGVTIYRNKILFGTPNAIWARRLTMGLLFGIILIPWAILARLGDK